MIRANHSWFARTSILLCLLTAHSALYQGTWNLFRDPAKAESCGGFAVPIKPASAKIAERQDSGLEAAKTRTGYSATVVAELTAGSKQQLNSELLSDRDTITQPKSALLTVRLGRAPPSFLLA